MTTTFTAGQMVRIDAPGEAGDGARGMIESSWPENDFSTVSFPVSRNECIRREYINTQIVDDEQEPPPPDPRIAIAANELIDRLK